MRDSGGIFSVPWTERAFTMAPVTSEEAHFGKKNGFVYVYGEESVFI